MARNSVVALSFVALAAAACGDTWGQRAVTGGAIGAGSGAVVGAATGGSPLTGAVVGGAIGAGVGAATTPKRRNRDRYYDRYDYD
ncbi:YMGG-like glycine zipper-containing protein [Reyranella sp. CPCC 100927]|uniref:YMGG-like glycine zipper-containing protein n=1 Tax=Reyranella sp. CPCC 100927 TaxID=2599616 RepID=UPI0011B5C98A|nr:YMGG-like glycine zipper-containing protein [Reyranella sp. CPCC 100927]TWT03868.1 hypothetical protein FQU96_28015 [Reyranella sp. CPCC 100927]